MQKRAKDPQYSKLLREGGFFFFWVRGVVQKYKSSWKQIISYDDLNDEKF